MKYSALIFIFVLVLSCANESNGFLNLMKLARKKDQCEQIVQKENYMCSRKDKDCRACCHFDLSLMNERYGEREYFLKEAVILQASQECVCLICKNYLQDFANKPFF